MSTRWTEFTPPVASLAARCYEPEGARGEMCRTGPLHVDTRNIAIWGGGGGGGVQWNNAVLCRALMDTLARSKATLLVKWDTVFVLHWHNRDRGYFLLFVAIISHDVSFLCWRQGSNRCFRQGRYEGGFTSRCIRVVMKNGLEKNAWHASLNER